MNKGEKAEGIGENNTPEPTTLTPEEKKRFIVQLRSEGKTYREIAKLLRVSPKTISQALKEETHKGEIEALREKVERIEGSLGELDTRLEDIEKWREEIRWLVDDYPRLVERVKDLEEVSEARKKSLLGRLLQKFKRI